MNNTSLKILQAVGKRGELPLKDVLDIGCSKHSSHVDQYPLSLLIEEDYLGCTLDHTPPRGAEKMREFSLAMMLHAFTIKPDSNGARHYEGTVSTGSVDPAKEKIFLKAKGSLYLSTRREKWFERGYAFLAGLLGGAASLWVKYILEGYLSNGK